MLKHRRIVVLRFGSFALVAFGALEIGFLGVRSLYPMAVRVAWAASALLVAWGLTYPGARRQTVLLSSLAAVSPVFYAALLWHRGGVTGVAFAFFLATPLVFAVLLRGEVEPVIAVSISNLGAGLGLLWLLGAPSMDVREWAMALLGAAIMAVYTAALHRRMIASEEAATSARISALERLGESEATRARADRATLVGQLAGGLAHEVNNPLGFMIANLSHLEQAVAERDHPAAADEELRALIRETAEGARRIAGVMGKLKACAFESDCAGGCSLLDAVSASLGGLQTPSGLQVHNEVPEALPLVAAAPKQLVRIVTQLLFAAFDAFDDSAPGNGHVWLRAQQENGAALFSVEDNGPLLWRAGSRGGVAELHRGKASGLGLALAHESVRQWGGGLSVLPRPGGGTRIEVRVALAPPATPAASTQADPRAGGAPTSRRA